MLFELRIKEVEEQQQQNRFNLHHSRAILEQQNNKLCCVENLYPFCRCDSTLFLQGDNEFSVRLLLES